MAKRKPHGLALIHRDKDAAKFVPGIGDAIGVVFDPTDWECSQSGRQRITAIVVGNAQRALKLHAEMIADMNRVIPNFHIQQGPSNFLRFG